MKQIQLKKYEFEYRAISRLVELSGISGPSGSKCMERKQRFTIQTFCHKYKELDKDFEGRNHGSSD